MSQTALLARFLQHWASAHPTEQISSPATPEAPPKLPKHRCGRFFRRPGPRLCPAGQNQGTHLVSPPTLPPSLLPPPTSHLPAACHLLRSPQAPPTGASNSARHPDPCHVPPAGLNIARPRALNASLQLHIVNHIHSLRYRRRLTHVRRPHEVRHTIHTTAAAT